MAVFWLLQSAGVAFALLYILLGAVRFGLPRWRTLGAGAAALGGAAALFLLFRCIVPDTFEGRGCLIAIALFPLLLWIFSGIFRLPIPKTPEFASPMLLIWLVFDRIACQCVGRCASNFQVDWGILNRKAQIFLLPLQLAEAAAVSFLALFLILALWRSRKGKIVSAVSGTFLGMGVILFAATFFRDVPVAWYGFSEVTLWAMFFMAEGFFWWAGRSAFSKLRDILGL